MIPPAGSVTPTRHEVTPVAVPAGDDIELSEDVDFDADHADFDPASEIEPRWLDRLRPRGMRSHEFEGEI